MKNKINIVTGKIQSGKTTGLFKLLNTRYYVDGILSPIVNEKRVLYHIASKTIKRFEVDESNEKTISIGNYIFLQESFDWANEKLIKGFSNKPDFLVIDELGKLELKGKGFYPSIKEILEIKENLTTQLILVIRDYLLDEVLHYYGICDNEYEILNI
jgi:nucleoside-triphosphatase THEP1